MSSELDDAMENTTAADRAKRQFLKILPPALLAMGLLGVLDLVATHFFAGGIGEYAARATAGAAETALIAEGYALESRIALFEAVFLGLQLVGLSVLALFLFGSHLPKITRMLSDMSAARAELEEKNAQLEHMAHHDQLTGLLKPDQLYRIVPDQIDTDGDKLCGLFRMELSGIEAIRNTHGRDAWNTLFKTVADRLKVNVSSNDIVMRGDGGEFMLLAKDLQELDDLGAHAEFLIQTATRPINVGPRDCRLDVNVGIAAVEGENLNAEELLRAAGIALEEARRDGRGAYRIYADEMGGSYQRRSALIENLRKAIASGQIEPWFQPQICVDSGRIVGFESLVRWIDPKSGPKSPGIFLPIAKEAGLLGQIDDIVRRQALNAFHSWCEEGIEANHIGLNLTGEQLSDPSFIDRLQFDMDAAGVEPHQVAIEVLESVAIDGNMGSLVKRTVSRLSELGFYIELDDFGTGHAGPSSLRDLKVDRVKIDRSFVTDVHNRPELQKFTASLISLARSLDIAVLAEGIELREELDWLQEQGCEVVQGYIVSKPLPGSAVLPWADAHRKGLALGARPQSYIAANGS